MRLELRRHVISECVYRAMPAGPPLHKGAVDSADVHRRFPEVLQEPKLLVDQIGNGTGLGFDETGIGIAS
mgnify:CR=1 FL=1